MAPKANVAPPAPSVAPIKDASPDMVANGEGLPTPGVPAPPVNPFPGYSQSDRQLQAGLANVQLKDSGVNAAKAQERAGIVAQGDAKVLQANEEAQGQQAITARMQADDARFQAHEDERQAQVRQRYAASEKALDDASNSKVDANRYWESKSTPQKILGAFAIMAGGIGGGMTHTPNAALAVIQSAIQDDIDAQKANINVKFKTAEGKRGLYHDALDMTGSERQAEQVAMENGLKVARQQIVQTAAKYKGSIEEGKTQELLGLVDAQTATLQRDRNDAFEARLNAQRAQAAAQAAAQRAKTLETIGKDYEQAQAHASTILNNPKANAEDRAIAAKIASTSRTQFIAQEVSGQGRPQYVGGEGTPDKAEAKDLGERTVVVDGKEAPALSKEKAVAWDKYNHARTVFGDAFTALKDAREKGDVGAYNSARATLIETYPELLGYSRAPTEGQIKHTVGPEAIPEYNHWYASTAAYKTVQGRAEEKIKRLDSTLAASDAAMRQNTFGTKQPTTPADTHDKFKVK